MAIYKRHKWNYTGDMNLEYGGTFWREDDADDYVLAVCVTPCSDAGGPDNLFHIESGSIYMPADKEKDALPIIGKTPEAATRLDKVIAFQAYWGVERSAINGETVIQIGKKQDSRAEGWSPKPDVILRGNASLARYVRREMLD